ncbi:unnamed protein product [Closterium sp. NIES-54]
MFSPYSSSAAALCCTTLLVFTEIAGPSKIALLGLHLLSATVCAIAATNRFTHGADACCHLPLLRHGDHRDLPHLVVDIPILVKVPKNPLAKPRGVGLSSLRARVHAGLLQPPHGNQVATSGQVFATASRSSPVSGPCSYRPLSHETLLWHHHLVHPSLPRLRGMASWTLVSGLPRSLPPLPPGPAPTCVPCVEGRQRATPHSSEFLPTEAPLLTLHMDGEVREVLIDWIRGAHRQLSESFGSDLSVLRLHLDKGGEISSDLLRAFYCAEGIRQMFTLLASPQQNGIAERRIGMVMDVTRTSMIHAAAPHFLWPFTVQYAVHHINLQPHVSLPETTPTLRWTGKVGDASVFRVWGSRAFVREQAVLSCRSLRLPWLPPSRTCVAVLPPQLAWCSVLSGCHV